MDGMKKKIIESIHIIVDQAEDRISELENNMDNLTNVLSRILNNNNNCGCNRSFRR